MTTTTYETRFSGVTLRGLLQVAIVVILCSVPLKAYAECDATGDILFTVVNNAPHYCPVVASDHRRNC
jgi:hypothetical protein